MATKKPQTRQQIRAAAWLGKLAGAGTEAKDRARRDAAERADEGRSPTGIILNPGDVHGDYDAKRLLTTTLGGRRKLITPQDLAVFRKNARTVQSRYRGGIKPRDVIDMALSVDRRKARSEIRMAVPSSSREETVRFVTNAGPHSADNRHFVTVSFLSFAAAVAAGQNSALKMANWLRKEPVKYDCDCGRHRYWYRYITTIGNFNAGRAETGYPKVRNPDLSGVACKHVLRVMAEIESSSVVLSFLARMIETARKNEGGIEKKTVVRTTQKQAETIAEKQVKRARQIRTTTTREEARARQALVKSARAAAPPQTSAPSSRRVGRQSAQAAAALLGKQFGLSSDQVLSLLEGTRNAQ